MEGFNVDDVTDNDVIKKINIVKEKKSTRVPIVITDINLAS